MSTPASTDLRSHALEFWACLLRGHAAVRRSVTARLEAAHGLTVNDYEALLLLSRAENNYMRRVDLAMGLQLTASGVTRLLDGLEEQGLVRKAACSTDARVTYAVLTNAGHRKLEQASAAHVSAIKALFEERYTPGELAVLAELLARLPGATGTAPEKQLTA
jgi:MarR family 2-MHQ and catechol resistance regulon transcriptional repressor